MMEQRQEERIAFFEIGRKFFSVGLMNHPVSNPLIEYYRMLASFASARSTQQSALSFSQTDFREDVKSINIPTLIIHGNDDMTVPIEASSARTPSLIQGCEYKVYSDAPHALFYTHRKQLNEDLVSFIKKEEKVKSYTMPEMDKA